MAIESVGGAATATPARAPTAPPAKVTDVKAESQAAPANAGSGDPNRGSNVDLAV